MKKTNFLSIVLVLLISIIIACQTNPAQAKGNRIDLSTIVHEGCEYVMANDYYNRFFALTHKGNCKNFIHGRP